MNRLEFLEYQKPFLPSNLKECFDYLKVVVKEKDIKEFKRCKEKDVIGKYHFGFGTTLRNNLKLWDEKSKLHNYFKKLGIWHADDMSGIILNSWHRHLNNKSIKLEKQIQYYKNYWAKGKK